MMLFLLSVLRGGGGSARCAVYLLRGARRLTAVALADFARERLKAAGRAGFVTSGRLKERKIKPEPFESKTA